MEHDKNLMHVSEIRLRDVCIVPCEEEQKYYLYESVPVQDQTVCEIHVRESRDLMWWTAPRTVFAADETFWGPLDFWAPECHRWKGKYFLISSFRGKNGYRGCQFLQADDPLGPFVPLGSGPATPPDWQCLDGTLYTDRNGDPWMVFCHEWAQVQDGQMAAIRMKEDLSASVGDPVILFRASQAPWRFQKDCFSLWNFTAAQPRMGWGRITDGPYLMRMDDDSLIMIWSSYSETGYSTGVARSLSGEIQGPWVQEKEPLYTQDGGHAMLFRRLDGTLMMALHSPNIPMQERMLLFEMEQSGGTLHIVNELTGNWLRNRYHADGSQKSVFAETAGSHV